MFDVENVLADAGLRHIAENREPFVFAVVCYTFSRKEKISLIETIRKIFPSTQILELYLTDEPVTANALETSVFRRIMKSTAIEFNEPLVASGLAAWSEYC